MEPWNCCNWVENGTKNKSHKWTPNGCMKLFQLDETENLGKNKKVPIEEDPQMEPWIWCNRVTWQEKGINRPPTPTQVEPWNCCNGVKWRMEKRKEKEIKSWLEDPLNSNGTTMGWEIWREKNTMGWGVLSKGY
jgi:hypothetical protein